MVSQLARPGALLCDFCILIDSARSLSLDQLKCRRACSAADPITLKPV